MQGKRKEGHKNELCLLRKRGMESKASLSSIKKWRRLRSWNGLDRSLVLMPKKSDCMSIAPESSSFFIA